MRIKKIDRTQITKSRKVRSKYGKVVEFLDDLKPGGDAVAVEFKDQKQVNSLRNLIYNYNTNRGTKVKTSTDQEKNTIYFFID